MRCKVEVIAREIARLGIGVRAIPFRGWIDSPEVRDALKSCDVIFGRTDDHDGRLLLDRFARFYAIPVIDVGLAMEPGPGGVFRDMGARVTVLVPEAPCLVCRSVIAPHIAAEEALARRSPAEYARRKREAYIRGGGDPAPAVVTFTTEAATMAVNELLQGLTDFRGEGGWAWHRVRRLDQARERRPGAVQRPHCALCGAPENSGARRRGAILGPGRVMERLRAAARCVLEAFRVIPRSELAAVIRGRHPGIGELPEGLLVVVRGSGDKWAVFRCPGECGEKLQLSLVPRRRPRWSVGQIDQLDRPTISPSVRVTSGCRCHFHVRQGQVDWCADSGHRKQTS